MSISYEIKRLTDKALSLRSGANRRVFFEKRRLRQTPRYQPGTTNLFPGYGLQFSDSLSLVSAYQSIFEDRVYDFECSHDHPRILDCGANIGLASIFFAMRFPRAEVVAFEADPKVFGILQQNCRLTRLSNIEIRQQAVWTYDGEVTFESDGADAGRLVAGESKLSISVPCVSLLSFLNENRIDLLKIDIEGAECEVLQHCESGLGNVDRVFVEYHSYVDRPQELAGLLNCLERAGFRVHVQPEFYSSKPFIHQSISEGMDNRINIFATRSREQC